MLGFLALAAGREARATLPAMIARLEHRPGAGHAKSRRPATAAGWTMAGTPVGATSTPAPAAKASSLRRLLSPPAPRPVPVPDRPPAFLACDGNRPDSFALAAVWEDGRLALARDPVGLRPLYYLESGGRPLAFASEFKAFGDLKGATRVFPPGHVYVDGEFYPFTRLEDWPREPCAARNAESAAAELRRLVEDAVERGYRTFEADAAAATGTAAPVAVFLSGGIDSSVVAAAAANRLGAGNLRSFSVGTSASADLPNARLVAEYLGIRHTERVLDVADAIRVLPRVIYHLESFDPPLVRSSVANYLVAEMAAEAGCRLVFCGEGGDELFAGYAYLKNLRPEEVSNELLALLKGGQNNGFQRVDRMTSAHGLEARVPLASKDLVSYALRVPLEWKIDPEKGQEKWILRRTFKDLLPETVIQRPKAKFYEGSGTERLMARVAAQLVSDADLERQRGLEMAPGHRVETKEQLLYYRLFREWFPQPSAVETIGWTRTVDGAAAG